MSKTIKELADELGVSKQTIQYHYQRLLAKDRQKDSRGFNVIKPRAEREIRSKVAKSFLKNRQRSSKEPTNNRQRNVENQYPFIPTADQDKEVEVAKRIPTKNHQKTDKEVANNRQRSSKEKTSGNAYLIEQIEDLKRQRDKLFASKEKELASKDRQIENLVKLLDQAQQLQLIAEQKIENQKKELVTVKAKKEGFWYKIFH